MILIEFVATVYVVFIEMLMHLFNQFQVCYKCKPHREYIRLFDTTENTGVRRHQTGRSCKACGGPLRDTIVHFGEKGGLKSPYRWKEAAKAAEKTDLILCLGSSLKVILTFQTPWQRPCMYKTGLFLEN